ncbi:NUDIX domain-containing protein [Lipingzhangella sp. LS1_29]|uniref:NUDIX domain-containing protein n=1 Tax=Lipingzhangella rawalii TaxID=2055835 RepID=A0ABU2H299_9ACTN|nr:NUDIX domain-containing protein [Lipingzhangella rawalii]MDS1268989.1 NUDIX domain-containing protein [Lipingzhangella rawalii]
MEHSDRFDSEWDRVLDATLGVRTSGTHTLAVDVHVLLRDDTHLLLVHRANTGSCDGMWTLPSGRLHSWEALSQRASREVREQLALYVPVQDLEFAHVTHHRGSEDRIGFFFATSRWHGHPHNAEPDRHDAVSWFHLDDLPENLLDYCATGIHHYRRGIPFSLHNWGSD